MFDDYQKVGEQSSFHEAIRDGLSRLPEGIHAFVISRSDPPPLFARKRAHQRMEWVGWKELRLTPEEAKGIARLRGKRRSAGEVLSLQGHSDGWAAGLVLLLEESAGLAREPRRMKDTPPEKVFEYFAGEIFTGLGEKAKSFLLKSACLPRMTARMAERITGLRRAGVILSYLNRNNYFTEMHRYAEPVYEYHPLFREFLLSRAREIFPAKLFPADPARRGNGPRGGRPRRGCHSTVPGTGRPGRGRPDHPAPGATAGSSGEKRNACGVDRLPPGKCMRGESMAPLLEGSLPAGLPGPEKVCAISRMPSGFSGAERNRKESSRRGRGRSTRSSTGPAA